MTERKNLKIVYGFPTIQEESAHPSKNKGISLLIALLTISMMVGLMADMIISSSVNVEMGVSLKNKIKAEYLAKSGNNLAVFLISVSLGVDLFRASDLAGPAKAAPTDTDSSIWSSLNQLPPMGADSVKMLKSFSKGKDDDPFHLGGFLNEEIAKQMAQFEDSFSVKVSDESSKINLSLCTKETTCPIDQLVSLFSGPAEKEFLDKKNLQPKELAYRILDFISEGEKSSDNSGLSGKDGAYEKYNPPYKAKRLPLDSIDELKLIEGWDDDVHNVFSPYLTVYPYYERWTSRKAPPLNINTARVELLRSLVPSTMESSNKESFLFYITDLKKKKTPIAKDANELATVLKDKFFYSETPEEGQSSQERNQWFTNRSDTFRVEVEANTGNQTVNLLTIIRRIQPKDPSFGRQNQQTKRSYQILYNRAQ